MRFSERVGAREPRYELQVGSMNNDLRTALWNAIYQRLERILMKGNDRWQATVRLIWHNFLRQPINDIPKVPIRAISRIQDWFFGAQWYEVYDLIEIFAEVVPSVLGPHEGSAYKNACNEILEKESAGYRFVGGYNRSNHK